MITKDAKSKKGIFSVHQVKDKYYYEIPNAEFGKEFLLNTRIAKTTIGVGYGGQQLSTRVVYWELKGNKVNLRSVNYDIVADPKTPIAQAVQAANNDAILMTFPVAAFGADKASAVIEVTRLFTGDVTEFSARQRLNASSIDASRSYIERISPYPENIEAEASHTYTRNPTPPGAQNNTPAGPLGGGGMRPGSATVVLHHSMVKLPEKPMMPARIRRARRLLLGESDGLQPRRAARPAPRIHRSLAAGEEGLLGGRVRAGQADRLLHRFRHAHEMGPVARARRRGLAAGLRSSRFQERHHRQDHRPLPNRIPTSVPKTSAIP